MSWLAEMFSYSFMLRALIVGLAISLCGALIGVTVTLRRQSMLGDGLSHVTFGAFAVATVLGLTPLWFALPVAALASFALLRFKGSRRVNADAGIAIISASSLAIGIMAISVSGGVNVDINSYLFGSILSVGWNDVWICLLLAALVAILYIAAHSRIFAITFDEEFAKSIGVKTVYYDVIFALICSAVVVLGMRLLGALLISSLIVFPTITAMQFARSFKQVTIYAALISVAAFLIGLVLSYLISTPTGATVVVVNLAILCLAKLFAALGFTKTS